MCGTDGDMNVTHSALVHHMTVAHVNVHGGVKVPFIVRLWSLTLSLVHAVLYQTKQELYSCVMAPTTVVTVAKRKREKSTAAGERRAPGGRKPRNYASAR